MPAASATSSTIDQLRSLLVHSQVETRTRTIVGSGFDAIDRLLPESGLSTASVIEWISDGPGLRTTSIALKCASLFLDKPGALAVVDPHHNFHAASIDHLGIPLHRLLLVRPGQAKPTFRSDHLSEHQRAETLWALEQLARCSGVRVVLTWIDRLSSTAQRRLQLAVEKSGATVILIRPTSALQVTSWADLQFHVTASSSTTQKSSKIEVTLLKCRHAVQQHGHALMEADDETGDVLEIPELVRSTQTKTAAN